VGRDGTGLFHGPIPRSGDVQLRVLPLLRSAGLSDPPDGMTQVTYHTLKYCQ
jgi:hypothetical protein